ncbi:MAG TPA: MFS transporter [Actinopolymorphaceae bacterium]
MLLRPYRRVLALPRVTPSLLLLFAARLPMAAMGLTLTLHLLDVLGRGYAEAGLVGTATMLGSAVGAPVVGRMIDRTGLRPVVLLCGTAATSFWLAAPHLPYEVLLVVALPAGMLAVPAGSIARQVLAALVPIEQRRAAYSLDTISVETTFMIAPAAGIFVSTQLSSTVALSSIGVAFGLVAIGLVWMNPPIRNVEESPSVPGDRPPLRTWMTGRLAAALLIATGTLFVLVGTEIAVLAALRENGETPWAGPLITILCIASLIGGLAHGAVKRSLSQLPLMLLLAVLTMPAGLFDHPWWLLALALVPANFACAPTLAATTETISLQAPARVRGEVMGMQDMATRLGLALGSPVVGLVIDHSDATLGFVAAGAGGLVFAAVGLLLQRVWAERGSVETPAAPRPVR